MNVSVGFDQQGNWQWCKKCQALAFAGGSGPGPCPAHDHTGSGNYVLTVNAASQAGWQANWQWCNKCQTLAFAGGSGPGPCAAGGTHDHTGSGNYQIELAGRAIGSFWTLSMHAGPVPVFLASGQATLEFTVTNITWQVTPDYMASGFPKTIPVNSPSPPTVVTNVQLPIPTGTVKTVQVTISGEVFTAGGNVNGYVVGPQSIQIIPDTRTVSQNSTTETIAWLLAASGQQDPQNPDNIALYVSAVFQGISP
jgi:hypothetical protein